MLRFLQRVVKFLGFDGTSSVKKRYLCEDGLKKMREIADFFEIFRKVSILSNIAENNR